MVTALLTTVLALTGCSRQIDGAAVIGSREPDPADFFAGDVPSYGQTVSPDDAIALTYLRAMRRIDPCGLLTRDTLAKVGEIGSVGTLFAFDECDIDIKVPGEADRRFVSVEVVLSRTGGEPAFRAGGLPVYETYPGSCDYLLPLELSRVPGARPLPNPDQPFLRIGLIAEDNCDFAQRLARAVAPRIESLRLPIRDAVAAYPVAMAERDPCQVLSVLGTEVVHWDIDRSRPYECDFSLRLKGIDDVAMRVSLKPQLFDPVNETRARRDRDGVELFVDETFCSAVVFVGGPMQRKLVGGDFVDTGDLVIRPAVVIDSGGERCDVVADVATAAAKLYT
jgi:hypothetical protein